MRTRAWWGAWVAAALWASTAMGQVQTQLPGKTLPQFVDPLPSVPAVIAGTDPLTLRMCEFRANMLPVGFVPASGGSYLGTWAWGYFVDSTGSSTCAQLTAAPRGTYLGPVIVATRGVPTQITWINDLGTTASTNLLAYKNSTDQTLHWADPLGGEENDCSMNAVPGQLPVGVCASHYGGPIPATAHLHGGEVPALIDGGPASWFLSSAPDTALFPDARMHGHTFYSMDGNTTGNWATYRYPNTQEAAPLWFHDHTLGATRLNVYAGLAGAFLLTDPSNPPPANLPGPAEIIPLVLQDRAFDVNGQLFFANTGLNPEHPYWIPEFTGDTQMVNGKAWPFLNVQPRRYRFLILNGSNARGYELSLQSPDGTPPFWQIGTDGGYLDAPVRVDRLLLLPGERADVIIDFGGMKPGTRLELRNSARFPYPGGTPTKGTNMGRVMEFRIACTGACPATDASYNPNPAAPAYGGPLRTGHEIVRLVDPAAGTLAPSVVVQKTRQLTLNEIADPKVTLNGVVYPGGPREILVNNTKWSGASPRPYGDFTPVTIGGITTYYSELPREGDTEVWEIVNLTADAHPIHLHLVQFQLISRQVFTSGYFGAYAAAFPAVPGSAVCTGGVFCPAFGPPLDYDTGIPRAVGGNPDVTPFLKDGAMPPLPNEAGWKDTVVMLPGQVTRIAVRWAPTDLPVSSAEANLYFPFDPSEGAGYVWHCHIIDHEDNEMMRPDLVQLNPAAPAPADRPLRQGIDY